MSEITIVTLVNVEDQYIKFVQYNNKCGNTAFSDVHTHSASSYVYTPTAFFDVTQDTSLLVLLLEWAACHC